MKKFYWILLSILAMCLAFSACSDKKENPPSGSTAKNTATAPATKTPQPTSAATPNPSATIPVYVQVDDLEFIYVVNVKYKDGIETWNKVQPTEATGLDIDELAIEFEVPNDGSEVELTAVLQKDAPYKIKGWSGDEKSTTETLKFTPKGNTVNLKIEVERLSSTNVAEDATVKCSASTEEAPTSRWSAAFLTDTDMNNRFSTSVLTDADAGGALATPVTIDIDMKEAKDFNTLCLIPRCDAVDLEDGVPNFPMEFEILVSKDGTNYTSVKKISSEENVNDMMQSYDLGAQNAQYIRISVTKLGTTAADEGMANPYRIQLVKLFAFNK